jgi:RNase P/RNase MRP subunit POP5
LKRIKRRYLAMQWEFDGLLGESEFMNALWGTVARLFGEYGASLTNLSLIDYREESRMAIVRVNLVAVEMIKASAASVTSVSNKVVAINTVAASGTIKGLSRKLPKTQN